jgi:protein SCO1/2
MGEQERQVIDMRTRVFIAAALAVVIAGAAAAQPSTPGTSPRPGMPSTQTPAALEGVRFEQRLDAQLPLDVAFRDEEGRAVTLGDYFGEKPVILAFVYYECPMLCTQVLNGLTRALRVLNETVGRDFDVVAISFDPRETPVLADGKKKTHLDEYGRKESAPGWHFLTGSEASIRAVTSAAGFHYRWDAQTGQFAHPSGIVVATPEGRLSRYFFGIEYAPRDLKFALIESSAGRIGNPIDQLLLYCYHYDPSTGAYGFVAMNAVRIGGVVTVLALLGFILLSGRREARAGH